MNPQSAIHDPQSKLDCTTCGACCISPFAGEGYISLDEEEAGRLGRLGLPVFTIIAEPVEDRVVLLGTRDYRQGRRACVVFEGVVGETCRCARYEERPRPCRQFEAGSPACRQARQALGLE